MSLGVGCVPLRGGQAVLQQKMREIGRSCGLAALLPVADQVCVSFALARPALLFRVLTRRGLLCFGELCCNFLCSFSTDFQRG